MSTPDVLRWLGVLASSYLLGSIPTSYILGRLFFGVDPRKHGSGGTGATNSLRTLGGKAALIVVVVDVSKGFAAVTLAGHLVISAADYGVTMSQWAMVVACIFAIAGHAFSPWIGFKGGKGVATGAGSLLAMMPVVFWVELVIFIAIVVTTRYVSLGSIVIAAILPVWVILFANSIPFIVLTTLVSPLVIWLHRSNIGRLIKGNENRLSFKNRGVAKRGAEDRVEGDNR